MHGHENLLNQIKQTILRLNSILAGSVVLLTAYTMSANSENLPTSDFDLEDKNSMTWPMLPGESLNELAAKFYPKNKAMQKQFVFKTLRLNAEELPKLGANSDFVVPTAVVIPTLKSLANSTHAIKSPSNKRGTKIFQMSYNFQDTIEKLPKGLIEEYESLVTRNDFLKEELDKLNEKLVFLQNKLNDLKLVLDRTLTLPKKKIFKNLDATEAKNKTSDKPVVKNEIAEADSILDFTSKNFWLTILGLGLAFALGSYLLKKYRERAYIKFINSVTQQEALTSFGKVVDQEVAKETNQSVGVPLGADTEVDEYKDRSILDEARKLMEKSLPIEAIEHVKWAIRAKPKASIMLWLYLLEIFRKQNIKDEFEKYAFEMHQTFNVMTPLWEEKEVEIVVADSLEKFPHIIKKVTAEWPSEPIKNYLQSLIADNREGERTGFGQAVIDEILTLISVLEARNDLWEIKDLIKENAEQIV